MSFYFLYLGLFVVMGGLFEAHAASSTLTTGSTCIVQNGETFPSLTKTYTQNMNLTFEAGSTWEINNFGQRHNPIIIDTLTFPARGSQPVTIKLTGQIPIPYPSFNVASSISDVTNYTLAIYTNLNNEFGSYVISPGLYNLQLAHTEPSSQYYLYLRQDQQPGLWYGLPPAQEGTLVTFVVAGNYPSRNPGNFPRLGNYLTTYGQGLVVWCAPKGTNTKTAYDGQQFGIVLRTDTQGSLGLDGNPANPGTGNKPSSSPLIWTGNSANFVPTTTQPYIWELWLASKYGQNPFQGGDGRDYANHTVGDKPLASGELPALSGTATDGSNTLSLTYQIQLTAQ